MRRTSFADMPCSVARTLEVVGEWWSLLIVRDAFLGVTRFDDLQSRLGIARNVLTTRLDHLVASGILERRPYQDAPLRYEYVLTDKGRDLIPILLAFLRWGDRYTTGRSGPPVETVHIKCGHAFHMVPTCSHCGEEVDPRDMQPRLGPGATTEQRNRAERRAERHEREAAEAA
jgi:DNA-binding HxlR family transcriptional regulator